LAGIEGPKFTSVETNFEESQRRVALSSEYVKGIDPDLIDQA
jgi:hypothetical protein